MRTCSFVVACLLYACGSSPAAEAESADALIAGFDPPAPLAGETRLVAPVVRDIPPGVDITWCTYVKNPFGREVDVVKARGFQSTYGHHAILMEVPGSEDRLGQSHECTDRDMTNARFLAGGSDGAAKFQIPEGIGFRIPPESVLMVQTHWINTSDAPVSGQAVFNVGALPPDGKRHSAQLFASYTVDVEVPPRGRARARTDCEVQEDLKFFTFGGHAHEWGTHVTIAVKRMSGAVDTIYDRAWKPEYQADPPLEYYPLERPLELRKGDVLSTECEYDNHEDLAISFPREMCVGLGFYFPGTADIQCADGRWITR